MPVVVGRVRSTLIEKLGMSTRLRWEPQVGGADPLQMNLFNPSRNSSFYQQRLTLLAGKMKPAPPTNRDQVGAPCSPVTQTVTHQMRRTCTGCPPRRPRRHLGCRLQGLRWLCARLADWCVEPNQTVASCVDNGGMSWHLVMNGHRCSRTSLLWQVGARRTMST
jgi:hypothetical protein